MRWCSPRRRWTRRRCSMRSCSRRRRWTRRRCSMRSCSRRRRWSRRRSTRSRRSCLPWPHCSTWVRRPVPAPDALLDVGAPPAPPPDAGGGRAARARRAAPARAARRRAGTVGRARGGGAAVARGGVADQAGLVAPAGRGAAGRIGDLVRDAPAALDAGHARAAVDPDALPALEDGEHQRRLRDEAELAPRDDAAVHALHLVLHQAAQAVLRRGLHARDHLDDELGAPVAAGDDDQGAHLAGVARGRDRGGGAGLGVHLAVADDDGGVLDLAAVDVGGDGQRDLRRRPAGGPGHDEPRQRCLRESRRHAPIEAAGDLPVKGFRPSPRLPPRIERRQASGSVPRA